MRELINAELIFASDSPKNLCFAEFIFANEPSFDRFSWGVSGKRSKVAEFIIAKGQILGIAEFNFAKKGKIRNN